MTRTTRLLRPWLVPAGGLLLLLAVGCHGRDPVLGETSGTVTPLPAPTVIAVAPANNATAIPTNLTVVTANFSEAMAPLTGTATFTVTAASPGVSPVGTVTLDTTKQVASFTFTGPLTASTVYTGTITGAKSLVTGLALASPYTWTFTTGLVASTTRPLVTLTEPTSTLPAAVNVPINFGVTATFSKDMTPLSIVPATGPATFTVTSGTPAVAVPGTVSYSVVGRIATFTPATPTTLIIGTLYTATVTLAATDLAGNALAGITATPTVAANHVWQFTTVAALLTPPTITLTNPANLATNVPLNSAVNASFSTAMNVGSISFKVQPSGTPLGTALLGTLAYDALSHISTFTPSSPLTASTSYTATITGATDLAGNPLGAGTKPNPWTFTTGTTLSGLAPGAVTLGSTVVNGIMATSAITNTGAATMINGNVCLEPGTSNGLLPVQVNGQIHLNDTVSHQAGIDLLVAYNFAKNLPPGTTVTAGADLAAVYPLGIPPGTYTSGSTMLVSTPLIMDAGGNANAVWVFQIGSSLTTTANISLVNGAQAKNIFWVPTLDATIGVGSTFYGTIVTGRDATAKTGAVINGRILAGATLAGTIALDTNTVNVPAP